MSTTSVDVAVVGCGVIGASVAWRLAQHGLSVTCFDPKPGDGATYAAAGMLAAVTEASFGEHALTRLNVESSRRWPAFAKELEAETGLPTGLRRTGALTVAFDAGDRQELRRLLELRRRWGLDVEEVTITDARRIEPLLGPRLAGAIWAPTDDQVNPRQVYAALRAALQHRSVPVVPRRIVALARERAGAVTGVVDEAGQTHPASSVVVAAGWETHTLMKQTEVDMPVRPVKGQLVRLDASGHPGFAPQRVVRGVVQGRPIYLVPRVDGEIVVGATSEEQCDDRLVTAGAVFAVLRDARALVPGIDELPLVEMTARARPGTPDNIPVIGDAGVPGLLVAGGHHRNGILLGPLTADAIAARYRHSAVPDEVAVADPRRFAKAPLAPVGGNT